MKQFAVLLMLHLSISLFGQDSLALRPKKNSIQLEEYGNGIGISINYERILVKKTSYQFCGRLGLTPLIWSSEIVFITELDLLIGKKRTFLEIGSGFTYALYHDDPSDKTRGVLVYVPRIGFRFKFKDDGRFINFIRVGFTPLIGISDPGGFIDPQFQPFGGIAIGHSF